MEINNRFGFLIANVEQVNYCFGFDLEFVSFNNLPSIKTIQVAYNKNLDDTTVIILSDILKKQLLENRNNKLFRFLTSKDICKVGVNIIDDMSKIANEFQINPLGYIDIQSIAITMGFYKRSMDDLGLLFVSDYVLKKKTKRGIQDLSDEYIIYAKQDAINSLVIYYRIIMYNKNGVDELLKRSMNVEIDDACKSFAIMYLSSINKIQFNGFTNHMHSCYGPWAKIGDKSLATTLCTKLLQALVEENIIILEGAYYKINRNNNH